MANLTQFFLIEFIEDIPGRVYAEAAFSSIKPIEDFTLAVGTSLPQTGHDALMAPEGAEENDGRAHGSSCCDGCL